MKSKNIHQTYPLWITFNDFHDLQENVRIYILFYSENHQSK